MKSTTGRGNPHFLVCRLATEHHIGPKIAANGEQAPTGVDIKIVIQFIEQIFDRNKQIFRQLKIGFFIHSAQLLCGVVRLQCAKYTAPLF